MKTWDEAIADFKKDNNFRSIKKSCGNCRHFHWDEYDPWCVHADLMCCDALGYRGLANLSVKENDVCDKYEEIKDEN